VQSTSIAGPRQPAHRGPHSSSEKSGVQCQLQTCEQALLRERVAVVQCLRLRRLDGAHAALHGSECCQCCAASLSA
jgi:hypothetical protein